MMHIKSNYSLSAHNKSCALATRDNQSVQFKTWTQNETHDKCFERLKTLQNNSSIGKGDETFFGVGNRIWHRWNASLHYGRLGWKAPSLNMIDERCSDWDAIEGGHCADHDDAGKYLGIHLRKASQFTAEVILIEGRNK